ncbi:Uncharacterised protein [Salmonella enterica subsp. enterica serovar Bovismorbificans]|uniref:Uncharacterized protein n=1 Tax=Salmonella enterica subsp. enterica serovar Bovismorbificans TaxID=58097 RepID=A0A655E3M2_SALET|nr:Uncharacterised protein [Salmonella enterica subsp. enterica serovar Bovismorbificans]
MGTVSRHQHAASYHIAVFQSDVNLLLGTRHAGYALRAVQRNAWRFTQERKQTQPDIMQLRNVPQRCQTVVLRVESHKSGMAAIADVYGVDCRCAIGNRLPDANSRQLLTSARRQRNRSGVKAGMTVGFRRFRFNQVYRQRPMTELRDGQRQRRACHAAANDNDAHCCRAAAINASMSSAFFTTPAVRFSLPVSVMTMSSSIRTPMPRYASGTSASGAI